MIPENILLKVNRPGQYLGNELNVNKRDFKSAYIRFALVFPDVYAIGMSNLGLRIIYGLLNSLEDVVCERVFLPESDLEKFLRQQKKGIFSWESKKMLKEFDIIGFSLSYELIYTNVLKVLDLADIPLFSKDRDDYSPLIIGGGFCALNPEPLADFFDLFIIGEAEDVLLEFIDIYRSLKRKNKDKRPSRNKCLYEFKNLEGIYIPSFYNISYNQDGTIKKFFPNTEGVPLVVKKRFPKIIENSFYPCFWLLPYTEVIHDRMVLEIMRGCPHQCRFCQARIFYFPLRFRSIDRLLTLSRELFQRTGYEELSLGGLSVSDYPQLKILLKKLSEEFRDKKILISFSSLKEKSTIAEILSEYIMIKKSGLTFAPETGSPKLRSIIKKEFNLQDLLSTLESAYRVGFRHIKLYFMVGLPSEEDKDLDSIVEFADSVYNFIKDKFNRGININISINTFIPKPHTPFQWLAMERIEAIKEKYAYILSKAKNRRWLKLSFHNLYMSFLECLLSRGDRRLSQIIYNVYKKEVFNAYSNFFSFDKWQKAFEESGIDPEFYVYRRFSKEEILPWDFIDTGVSKELLWQDLEESGVLIL